MRYSPQALHDTFLSPGPQEHCAARLAQAVDAVPWTAGFDPGAFPPEFFVRRPPLDLRALDKHPALAGFHPLAALWRAFAIFPARPASLAVFSGVCAPLAHGRFPGAKKVLYCHGLPRSLFPQAATLPGESAAPEPVPALLARALARAYAAAARSMDVILAASGAVAHQLGAVLHLDSVVLPPPADLSGAAWLEQGDYLLFPLQAAHAACALPLLEALRALPGLRLILADADHGLGHRLLELSGQALASGVQVREGLTRREMDRLVGGCMAGICLDPAATRMPDHDQQRGPFDPTASFLASGKPVLAEAGTPAADLVKNGRTGVVLPLGHTAQDIARALESLDPVTASAMRPACQARAARLGGEGFAHAVRDAVGDRPA